MKNLILTATFVMMMTAVMSCGEENQPPVEGSKVGFALSFFRNANTVSPSGENVIVSPYSAAVALSMLEAGAEGQTKAEFDYALNGTFWNNEILGNEDIIVESANSAWISDKFNIRNKYVERLENDFGADISNCDYADPSTVKLINNWCSEHTAGKITQIVDKLTPDMVMVLINALYFKAPWESAFNPQLTHDDVFHGASGDKTVPMMYSKRKLGYAEYEGFQIAELPYKGKKYSMYLVLPPEGMDLNLAMPYLTEGLYNRAMDMLSSREVALTMPKFTLSTSMILNETLKNMGVREAFTNHADFKGMTTSGPVCLDIVKQKCYIDVNEEGTEAAAVTSAQIRMTAMLEETIMNVDRPFFFMIADRENENILFIGKVVNL